MKLEEGMYVRTKYGIARFIHNLVTKATIYRVIDKKIVYDNVKHWEDCLLDNEIIKASHNIIDLIQVGDYVNGEKVGYIDDCDGAMKEYYYDYEDIEKDCGHYFEEIKSIVTKEQMESMKYEVK